MLLYVKAVVSGKGIVGLGVIGPTTRENEISMSAWEFHSKQLVHA